MQEKLLERFLRYVAVTSQSNPLNPEIPSTPGQWDMARLMSDELKALGFQDVTISDHAVVIGHLPSNLPEGKSAATVGWCVHMDTVDAGLSPEIHPQVIRNYDGKDVLLNKEKDIWIRVADHPELPRYAGQDVVFTDGTSVLGADDKSAIANFMTAMEAIVKENRPHGTIYVACVPDEEGGLRGAKTIDFTKFPVDYCYTIDCCELGEVCYQTFNAAKCRVSISGRSAHPMSAKGVMVDASQIAVDLCNSFDRMQHPSQTEGDQGYIWINGIHSNVSKATVDFKIRDHNKALFEARKDQIVKAVQFLRLRHPKAIIEMNMVDTYGNIYDAVNDKNRFAIDNIFEAMTELGITPKNLVMRGGTDGSFISTTGILTPNYCTSAMNFHSNAEFLPLGDMVKATQITLKLVEKAIR